MGKVDLHLHSSASDGVLSPAVVVARAAELNLAAISLTDHDNVDGISPALEAVKNYPFLTFIPGVEISADIPEGEVHILGYFVDHTSPSLLASLGKIRNARLGRAHGMIEKLTELGISIEWERVKEIAGSGSVGRPHVARALLEKGYISTIQEAFTKYIGYNGPAYVPREKVTPAEAIEMILKANGLPVMAHPFTVTAPEILVPELVKSGLIGLEAYYKDYTAEERERLVRLAEKYDIITTGGSDYHGLDESAEVMMGEAGVPPQVVDNLTTLAEKHLLKPTVH